MSSYNATGKLSYTSSVASIPKHARVVKTAEGTVGLASATQKEIGTAENAAFAIGEDVCVRSRNDIGTRKMIAAKAIASGVKVYGAASGKISDALAAGSFELGTAETVATADGDIIEVAAYNPIVGAASP